MDLTGTRGMDIADLTGTRGMDLVWIFVGSYGSRLDLTDIRGSDGNATLALLYMHFKLHTERQLKNDGYITSYGTSKRSWKGFAGR